MRELRNGNLLLIAPEGFDRAVFSARLGGYSDLPHTASLNLGFGRGDSDETVRKNYELFLDSAGLPRERAYASQIHSDTVFYVSHGGDYGEGDGFVTDVGNITLIVRTADCLPILFKDPEAGVIGAVHAGWRGSVLKIASKCIGEMVKLGAVPERIRAAIGPSIHPCCFEVKEDFLEKASELFPDITAYILTKEGRTYADLQGLNRDLLIGAGVSPEHMEISELCTCCREDLFYSHRRSGARRGLMCAAIAL